MQSDMKHTPQSIIDYVHSIIDLEILLQDNINK